MRFILAMMLVAVLAIPAQAAFEGPQSSPSVTTAAGIAAAPDNASCVLQGNLIEKITGSKDKYTFKDSSGQVIVEIDDHVFAGRTVTPTMLVKLVGKVDTSKKKPSKMDVHSLEVLK